MTSIRCWFILVSGLIFTGALFTHSTFSSDDRINSFSFWTGVATLIALVVAIGEIVNSGALQKLIGEAVDRYAAQHTSIISAAAIVEVIALLDDSTSKVQSEEYGTALRVVQLARRFLVRVDLGKFGKGLDADEIGTLFNKAERKMQSASHSTPTSPMSPAQKMKIISLVNEIKTNLEKIERHGVKS